MRAHWALGFAAPGAGGQVAVAVSGSLSRCECGSLEESAFCSEELEEEIVGALRHVCVHSGLSSPPTGREPEDRTFRVNPRVPLVS